MPWSKVMRTQSSLLVYLTEAVFVLLELMYAVDLEKAMAPHSSTLAWKIPWTESLVGCCLWGRTESDMTEPT